MSTTPETPTPETDAHMGDSSPDYTLYYEGIATSKVVPAKLASKLERERDAARAENAVMREAIKSAFPAFSDLWNLCPDVPPWALDNADAALTKLEPFLHDAPHPQP